MLDASHPNMTSITALATKFASGDHPPAISPRSWSVYKSALLCLVRSFTTDPAAGWLEAETVKEGFVLMESMYSTSRNSHARAVWVQFRLWARNQGVTLPMGPVRAQKRRNNSTEPIPLEVGHAVRALFQAIPQRALGQSALLRLNWESLRNDVYEGDPVIMLPTTRSGFLILPTETLEHLRVLWNYACGDAEVPQGPLLPDRRGGERKMPLNRLQELLRASARDDAAEGAGDPLTDQARVAAVKETLFGSGGSGDSDDGNSGPEA
jgi:hypothetical protein